MRLDLRRRDTFFHFLLIFFVNVLVAQGPPPPRLAPASPSANSSSKSTNSPSQQAGSRVPAPTDSRSWFLGRADEIGSYLAAIAKVFAAATIAIGFVVVVWWFFGIIRGPVRVEVLDWSVPEEFVKAGISSQSAARLVMDQARKVQLKGFQGYEPHISFAFEKLPGDVDLELFGIKVRFLYPILVTISGRLVQVGGSIAKDEAGYQVTVWAKVPTGRARNVSRMLSLVPRSKVFDSAAELVVLLIDPVALTLALHEDGADKDEEIREHLRTAVRRDFPIRLGSATSLAELGHYAKEIRFVRSAVERASVPQPLDCFFLPASVIDRKLRWYWNIYGPSWAGGLGPLQLRDAQLSFVYTVQANEEENEEKWRKALQFDSSSVPAILGIADFHFNLGHFGSAEKFYRLANKLNPTSATIFCKWAENKLKQKDIDGAKRLFYEALAENPESVSAYLGLANLFFNDRNYEKAVSYYELGAKFESGTTDCLKSSVTALTMLGKREEAQLQCCKAISIEKDSKKKEELQEMLKALIA